MLGQEIAAALPELRAYAESRMWETATVRRPGTDIPDDSIYDTPEFLPEPVYGPTIQPHEGKCRIKAVTLQPRDEDSAGSTVTVEALEFHVPESAPALLPGDVVFMAADTYTPRLRGLTYRITASHAATDTTAQRVPITLMSGVPS